MAISKWSPFGRSEEEEEMPARRRSSADTFRRLQEEMNRVFEDFFESSGSMVRDPWGGSSMMGRGQQHRFTPRIDVSEDAESLNISAELPGMTKDDIAIHADEESVTITGEKEYEEETEDKGVYRSERSYGYFKRRIPFPVGVDSDNADARFQDGVLTVRFPKTGEREGQRLEIK